ncbi:hypothetical protein G6F32_016612 [Rhizopus arrhizus]|nr:hypothetical protein G6F32_016612 [Rhizopus arrhizus]
MVSGIFFTQVLHRKGLAFQRGERDVGRRLGGAPDEPGADADGDQHGQGYDGFFHLMGIASTPLLVPAALLSLGAAPAPL